jgi:hypothetical protein
MFIVPPLSPAKAVSAVIMILPPWPQVTVNMLLPPPLALRPDVSGGVLKAMFATVPGWATAGKDSGVPVYPEIVAGAPTGVVDPDVVSIVLPTPQKVPSTIKAQPPPPVTPTSVMVPALVAMPTGPIPHWKVLAKPTAGIKNKQSAIKRDAFFMYSS